MDGSVRLALLTALTLSVSTATHAEQSRTGPGYYYYPQPSYYTPYGYQAPRAPTPAPSTTPAKPPATVDASAAKTAASSTTDARPPVSERYPQVLLSELDAASGTFKVEQTRLGAVLADRQGQTLYVPAQEGANPEACGRDCARLWHPLSVDDGVVPAAPFGFIRRADGTRQWSYSGRPLYRWSGDQAEGDVTGDGLDGAWFALRVRRG